MKTPQEAPPDPPVSSEPSYALVARQALLSFVLTFVTSRTVVFLIMSGHMPNLFLFLHGTHVHHLNYGIFLLAGVAGYLLFSPPTGRARDVSAVAYGFAMALTFDEFGMWLHLGGSYWQRASVDAVIVLGAFLALLAFAPSLERLEAAHFRGFIASALALFIFSWVLFATGNRVGHLVGPSLRALELASSP